MKDNLFNVLEMQCFSASLKECRNERNDITCYKIAQFFKELV